MIYRPLLSRFTPVADAFFCLFTSRLLFARFSLFFVYTIIV